MAVYAGVFFVVYVVAMPVCILFILLRYRAELAGLKEPKADWLLGFLLDDYKLKRVTILWEVIEIVRKLSLACIGSFWGSKSPMAIGAALLVSVFFLVLQHHFRPFKNKMCNTLQQVRRLPSGIVTVALHISDRLQRASNVVFSCLCVCACVYAAGDAGYLPRILLRTPHPRLVS
jgi:hypothetical protein